MELLHQGGYNYTVLWIHLHDQQTASTYIKRELTLPSFVLVQIRHFLS